MDLKFSFLNGDLEVEVYVEQSLGFVIPSLEGKVNSMKMAPYELKQAPHARYQ